MVCIIMLCFENPLFHESLFCLVPPYPSFSSYSLLPSPGDKAEARAEVSLQWSTSFTSQYAVERYHVSVNPDPSSCSSDQVSPSEDYSCSGLVLGTHYTFTVSAFNCGDQEGERSVFNISLCGLFIIERTSLMTIMHVCPILCSMHMHWQVCCTAELRLTLWDALLCNVYKTMHSTVTHKFNNVKVRHSLRRFFMPIVYY